MRSDEVHLYNGFIYSFIFGAFQKFDHQSQIFFVSGVRRTESLARFWEETTVTSGHIATVKVDGRAGKGDTFPRGVIVSVFHNAQRGDTSLVKHSLFIEYRWEKGKKCTDFTIHNT